MAQNFAKDTLISTIFGPMPIQDIKVGCLLENGITSIDRLGTAPFFTRVAAITKEPGETITITTDTGSISLEAEVLLKSFNDKWVQAKDVEVGEKFISKKGLITVTNVELNSEEDLFGIILEKNESGYLANNITTLYQTKRKLKKISRRIFTIYEEEDILDKWIMFNAMTPAP